MSKIGKKIMQVPKGVDIKVDKGFVSVKGPKGELKSSINPGLEIVIDGDQANIKVSGADANDKKVRSLWGLTRALLSNMIKGVTEGFEKSLEFEGVGYKANVKGDQIELNLGYSHPITVKAPEGITFKVEKNVIKVSGIDKELVGHVAAEIKSKRLPEPYKGSGIKYAGEIIRRKAGKKAATAS